MAAEYRSGEENRLIQHSGSRLLGLDGLRGFAILAVIVFHTTMLLPGSGVASDALVFGARMGWAGVDLFFVLSGFLITQILINTRESPSYYRTFYARRTLRIVPLYALACLLILHVVPMIGRLDKFGGFWLPGREISEWWYWLYLSNLKVVIDGHFHHTLLAIAWSLAIEEQFYLVWPAVVRRATPKTIERIAVGMIVGGAALRIALVVGEFPEKAIYVLTPCRFDALAVGAWIAAVWTDEEKRDALRRRARAVSLIGAGVVTLIIAAVWIEGATARRYQLVYDPVMQTIGYSALAVMFGAWIVMALEPTGRVARWTTARPLRLCGQYSYFMYLGHMPIVLAVREFVFRGRIDPAGSLGWQLAYWVVSIAACAGAGWLSWTVLESRMLRLKTRFPYLRP